MRWSSILLSIRRDWACAFALGVFALPALADGGPEVVTRVEARLTSGVQTDDGDTALARASVHSELNLYWGRRWSLEVSGLLEIAGDDTGLGTTDTYSSLAEPPLVRGDGRIEIDRAVLTWRQRGTRLSLGKQVTPWGVLDGVRVTDRFDAIRRREFVFTEIRPERIARWGARLQVRRGPWQFDTSAVLDPTVNQLAESGDVFDPTAPRLRGGLPATVSAPVVVSPRNRYFRDATYGARVSRRIANSNLSVLAFSGPETDPVLAAELREGVLNARLDYPRRSLFGATLDTTFGDTVWRVEAAHIPDQQVNTLTGTPLSSTERARTLVGVGMDWDAPGGWLVNLQLARDHLEGGAETLVRPNDDDIATVRLQRRFANDTWQFKAEWIGSVSDGDGAFRPSLEYRPTDTVAVTLGWDHIHGDELGVFGQFGDGSRVWLQLRATF